MTNVAVAEDFYTVQGEGEYVGTPAVFLRLAGCNLSCGFVGRSVQDVDPAEDDPVDGATWICDTADVWRQADSAPTPQELKERWQDEGWLEHIRDGAHIVLTGGEPTLEKHQKSFVEFYGKLLKDDVVPFVEVETNGTIEPGSEFDRYVNQYNVSVKLSNSGHDASERLKDEPMAWHAENDSSTFKFVVSRELDIKEVREIQMKYGIENEDVLLMPAGLSQEQLSETYPSVVELCKKEGYRFSQRLHVTIYDQMTGV